MKEGIMPTTLANTSQVGVERVKMRWKEPYVTEGLNRKFHGVIPPGIVRAGLLESNANGLEVKIVADSKFGDVIASYVDDDGIQTTIDFGVGNVIVDMSGAAGSTVYLCLYVDYTAGSSTIVEWRSYSESELFGASPVSEAGNLVIFGKVQVPGVGPIPDANVTQDSRTYAWASASSGLQNWRSLVKNGDFEQKFSWYSVIEATHAPLTLSSSAYEGDYSVDVTGDGAGVASVYLNQVLAEEVKPGDLLLVTAVVSDDSWDSGGYDNVIEIVFYDKSGSIISPFTHALDLLTGSSSWKKLSAIVEVPAGAVYAQMVTVRFNQSATNTGTLKIDSLRVYHQVADSDSVAPGHDSAIGRLWASRLTLLARPVSDNADRQVMIMEGKSGGGARVQYDGVSSKSIEVGDNTYFQLEYDLPVDTTPPDDMLASTNLCKAWAKFRLQGTSAPSVDDAFNFDTGSGIVRSANGIYILSFLNGFASDDYVVEASATYMGVGSVIPINNVVTSMSGSQFRVNVMEWNSGGGTWDMTDNSDIVVMVSVYGRD
jgi:hypothetical protein